MKARLCPALVALLACSGDAMLPEAPRDDARGEEPQAPPPAKVGGTVAYLTPAEHLARASIALRGMRPSRDELEAVRGDARYVEAIVDWYLTTPEFGAVIRELHEETLLTGVDPVLFPAGFPAIGPLAGRGVQELNQSIVEAPLRLIEHVVMNDRPYSEIVTADYTLADRTVAIVWGLPYDGDGQGWQVTQYTDARPAAGILSDSFLFTRHSTTFSNKSRGRANLISRALLCYDFLSREIPLDTGIDLADPAQVADAIRHNGACASCHRALDPLASYFAPFYPIYVPADLEQYPFRVYAPAFREVFSAAEPGYFGQADSGGDLRDLGRSIADDPRFSLCAAKRFYGYLAQLPIEEVPEPLAMELQGRFVDSGLDAKALAKAVVLSDGFRASHARAEASDAEADALRGLKKMRPSALARSVEALTGYAWRTALPVAIGKDAGKVGSVDLMRDAFFGWEVLAGGIDGNSVTRPSDTTSATSSLVLEGLAARASNAVVDADFAEADRARRRLLRAVDPNDTAAGAVRAQLAELSLDLYGESVDADDADIEAAAQLFAAALAENGGDGRRAWKLTLYALLQDARMVFY